MTKMVQLQPFNNGSDVHFHFPKPKIREIKLKAPDTASYCYKSVISFSKLILNLAGLPGTHLSAKSASLKSNLIFDNASSDSAVSAPGYAMKFLQSNYTVYLGMQERRDLSMQ